MGAGSRHRVVGAGLAVLLTGCTVVGPAPLDVPDGMEWDPATGLRSDILEIDARLLADDTGRPHEHVLAQRQAQQRLDEIVPDLEVRYPTFVALAWTEDGRLVAQFVGEAPGAALADIERAGVPVVPVAVRFGRADLERRQSTVAGVLRALGATDHSVGTDPWTQRILVAVSDAAGVTEAAIRAALPAGVAQQDVSIHIVVGPVSDLFGVGRPPVPRERATEPAGRSPHHP